MLREMRDQELRRPAPFSGRRFVSDGRLHQALRPVPNKAVERRRCEQQRRIWVDVPITRIVGITCAGHLSNVTMLNSFRDVLFYGLHGLGTTQDTVDFLCSDADKSEPPPQDYPRQPGSSKGALLLSEHSGWYIVGNGQQRAVIAMFALWQREGMKATLKNVPVSWYRS